MDMAVVIEVITEMTEYMNHPAKCFIEVFFIKTMENRKVKLLGLKEFP